MHHSNFKDTTLLDETTQEIEYLKSIKNSSAEPAEN